MNLLPSTLFGRTATTIAITMLLSMFISVSAAIYFIMIPMAKRSADDFAAVIVSAAHSLESLPEEMHAELKEQLLQDHGLIVSTQTHELTETSFDVPYSLFFRQSLARRASRRARSSGSRWHGCWRHSARIRRPGRCRPTATVRRCC